MIKEKFRFSIHVSNDSIKYIYFEPNAFEYKVKVGDVLEIVLSESDVPKMFYDKSTPFRIDIGKDALTIWMDVLPEYATLNDERVRFR